MLNTYALLFDIAAYSFVTAPCSVIFDSLSDGFSFIISVPSVNSVVVLGVYVTVHVVLFVTLFTVKVLFFIIPV